jgi:16S rRNA processing protein RimM
LTVEPATAGLLAIGRVARAHGLKGELRIEPFFEGSDALEQVDELWLSRDAAAGAPAASPARYVLEWARAVPRAYLVKVEGIEERNGAEALRGATVWVARSALPEPAASGEYYLVDLLGAKVVGPEGEIGTVVEIATHPSVDAIVIRTLDGRTLEQPLVAAFLARVSVAEKLVELSTLDGLV